MTDLLGTRDSDVETRLEQHRKELTGYCYRMLGSIFEAEDAVQETMVRAWRSYDKFEGRSQLRSWLYRIATNVCMDALNGRERRARPMDFGPAQEPVIENLGDTLPEVSWLLPAPDGRVVPAGTDPAEVAAARETLKLAFMATLQHLPPRQRAVLILCEVLRWKATEAAELLDTSVASVNSALQRARATLEAANIQPTDSSGEIDAEQRDLLDRYLDSFERYDMDALTALLAEDATLSMPPYALWMQGPQDIVTWMLGPGYECEGSRMIETVANGSRAFGQYRKSPDGGHEPWGLHVLETRGGRITGINVFLDTASLFPVFGLPPRL
jgi:RNA polymerase sigma-70 factor (ECF subfamily)